MLKSVGGHIGGFIFAGYSKMQRLTPSSTLPAIERRDPFERAENCELSKPGELCQLGSAAREASFQVSSSIGCLLSCLLFTASRNIDGKSMK